jgi:hypothetical protein
MILTIEELTRTVFESTAASVARGPFKGMTICEQSSWYGGSILQKLLGVYEQDLHQAIEKIIAFRPARIVNIGCAEGYYAVGLALRCSGVPILAIDSDRRAVDVCEAAAKANRVEAELLIECASELSASMRSIRRNERAAVIVDCEGCERDFLSLDVSNMESSVLLIEAHEFIQPGIESALNAKFSDTHSIEIILQGSRNPNEIAELQNVSEDLRWLAMSEGRPSAMRWMVAWPR